MEKIYFHEEWQDYIYDILKLHLAYVLRWNRGKNIYFFSHI